jgi:hypothetical protein
MKFNPLYNIGKDIYIDMQNEVLSGDILDVGLDNYGIIYNLYKLQNKDANLEYIQGREEKKFIHKESYDSCILLFSLSNLWFKLSKKNLFQDISQFLKADGALYIWDIDKSYTKLFKGTIKVNMPQNNIKEIRIKDLNVLKDASKKSTVKLLEQYFEIIDLMAYDNVYYIKAKKRISHAANYSGLHLETKGSTEHEDGISSNKFKVRSQQFSSKVFEGLYKGFKL